MNNKNALEDKEKLLIAREKKINATEVFLNDKEKRINLKEVQVNEKEKQNKEKLNRIGENEKHLKKREEEINNKANASEKANKLKCDERDKALELKMKERYGNSKHGKQII